MRRLVAVWRLWLVPQGITASMQPTPISSLPRQSAKVPFTSGLPLPKRPKEFRKVELRDMLAQAVRNTSHSWEGACAYCGGGDARRIPVVFIEEAWRVMTRPGG